MLPPRAAGSNRTNGTINGFQKSTSPTEMTVADLSPTLTNNPSTSTDTTSAPEPLRKVVVPPRQPVPVDAANGGQQGSNAINGQGPRIPAQAQKVLDQFVSLTGGGALATNNNSSAEVAVVESKLKRQAIELREAKAELA